MSPAKAVVKNSTGYTVGSLYAGIGGICRAFEKAGAKILWANEYDQHACTTYRENFQHQLYPIDVHELDPSQTAPVDILTSGFPCQAFSVAGYRKGFKDERGLHFFQTMKFLDVPDSKKPNAFLLENVKNLRTHDQGRTFERITAEIKKRGYSLVTLIFNTMDYGNTPQNRERVYMVGFKDEAGWSAGDGSKTSYFEQNKPSKIQLTKKVRDLLDASVEGKYYYSRFDCHKTLKKFITSRDTIYQWRRVYARENKNNVCPTLTANMGTGGHNVPLVLDKKGIRKLTPRECARFQGFSDEDLVFPKKMSDSHLYKQIGNSVSVPVVTRIAEVILDALKISPADQASRNRVLTQTA